MRSLILHTVFAGTLLGVSFAATGCLEQKVEVEVQPDGSGKLQFSRTFGAKLTALTVQVAKEGGDLASGSLSEWRGVAAWTDIEAEMTDGRLHVSATGWFEDLSKVALLDDMTEARFLLERDGPTLRVGFEREVDSAAIARAGGPPSPFAGPDPRRAAITVVASQALEGFRQETSFRLPAAAVEVNGFEQDAARPREVVHVRTDEQLTGMVDVAYEFLGELRAKIDAGELTEEEAEAQLEAQVKAKLGRAAGPFRASCTVPSQERDAAFAQQFAAAKATWEASEWPERVAKRRAKAKARTEGEAEGEAEAESEAESEAQ